MQGLASPIDFRAPLGNPWRTALPDWRERIMAGLPLVPDLPLFDASAQRALRVFRRLRIPDVIGTPTMAEACGDWYLAIVAALFGSYDPVTRRRMLQEAFLLIPKKNSKSSNGGALMLTAVIVNERPEAEFNLIAPTMEIANIAFKQAKGTIKLDPELDKIFQIRDHIKTIEHRLSGAKLMIKAADTDVITGSKSVGTMIDETHVFAKRANAADVFVEIRGALAARPDGFLMQTTTQSKDPPHGVFKAELDMARMVRDGEIDLPMLPVLYEYPDDVLKRDGWKDPALWHVVNPNLNRSVDQDFLRRELLKAEQQGKDQMILVASQHFNVEIGQRMKNDGWAGAAYWQSAQYGEPLTLDDLIQLCEVIVAGVDGGGLDDLLGVAFAGRHAVTKEWLFVFRAWAQPSVTEQRKDIVANLKDFEKEGTLVFCEEDDPTRDIREVADMMEKVWKAGLFPKKAAIGLDPVGVAAITDEIAGRGIGGDEQHFMAAVPQGYKLSGQIKGFERKLMDGTAWHDGTALMTWCVANARVELRGNATLITKQVSGSAKIDPLMAGFNAFALMALNPDRSQKPSVYETRGALVM